MKIYDIMIFMITLNFILAMFAEAAVFQTTIQPFELPEALSKEANESIAPLAADELSKVSAGFALLTSIFDVIFAIPKIAWWFAKAMVFIPYLLHSIPGIHIIIKLMIDTLTGIIYIAGIVQLIGKWSFESIS